MRRISHCLWTEQESTDSPRLLRHTTTASLPLQRTAKRRHAAVMTPREQSDTTYGFGLTNVEVERLRLILCREASGDVPAEKAWARAIELLSLFRMLLGPLPEDTHSSNIVAIDDERRDAA